MAEGLFLGEMVHGLELILMIINDSNAVRLGLQPQHNRSVLTTSSASGYKLTFSM